MCYMRVSFRFIGVSLGFYGVSRVINLYHYGILGGIFGVPRGVVGILMSHLGIKSFKFVLGYLWGYIGYEL